MRFISNGDFILPFQAGDYISQHIYMWSFQHGSANPNGIMRFPGRFMDVLAFAVSNNVIAGYFFIGSCLLVAFLSFWWFTKEFLKIKQQGVALIGSLFFTLNPIFLGNLSKVGLILAVAMLPLALTSLRLGFEKKRFSYFLLTIVAINIALLHPFTFSVNLIVCILYVALLARSNIVFMRDNLLKFGLLLLTALLLNAYCILPLASLGTVDKGALSDSLSQTPVDYTKLVDIANTGDLLTGLSLSKGVLKDYDFFGPTTWPFYFLGVLLFYVLMLGTYLRVANRIKPADRRTFTLTFGLFLVLLIMATVTYLHADVLIKSLIGLPGGWMFRSPLKWQLYIPLVLFTALVIALKYAHRRRLLYASLGLCFLLMNGYLFVQIYQRLLTPRTITVFSGLVKTNMDRQTLLFIDSNRCVELAINNPKTATELNQVIISKNTQVKHIESGKMSTVNISQYNYVLGCMGGLDETLLTEGYDFKRIGSYFDEQYVLYKNKRPANYLSSASSIVNIPAGQDLSGAYRIASTELGQPFILGQDAPGQITGLQTMFSDLSPKYIKNGAVYSRIKPSTAGEQQIIAKPAKNTYFAVVDNKLLMSAEKIADMQMLPAGQTTKFKIKIPGNQNLEVAYLDQSLDYGNLIDNGSLENGLWKGKVDDCYAYDKNASLSMELDANAKTSGRQSLKLEAKRHIACTSPKNIKVQPNQNYLLSFDYLTTGGRYAGYSANFNDFLETSSSDRLEDTKGKWESFTTHILAPEDATSLRLTAYAYPANLPGMSGQANYDNFKLTPIPDIKNRFFVTNLPASTKPAPIVSFKTLNPTKSLVSINSATEPFYLSSQESYHSQWQLYINNGKGSLTSLLAKKAPAGKHILLNNSMNGWYINPNELCSDKPKGCSLNSDGSYNIDLVMEFAPQRWFYVGSFISLSTAASVLVYMVYDLRLRGKL